MMGHKKKPEGGYKIQLPSGSEKSHEEFLFKLYKLILKHQRKELIPISYLEDLIKHFERREDYEKCAMLLEIVKEKKEPTPTYLLYKNYQLALDFYPLPIPKLKIKITPWWRKIWDWFKHGT